METVADVSSYTSARLNNPISVSLLVHTSMIRSTGQTDSALIVQWHQELALRTIRLSAASPGREHDGRRCTVLMAACRLQDVFFVKLHQLCCMWSIDKASVYEILDYLAAPDAISFALEELHKILNGGDSACCDLEWFANFPYPARRMLTSFPERSLAIDIAEFTAKFASFWHSLLDRAEAHDRPVLGVELRDTLHCPSPLLRYILFVTSCLQIGIVTGPEAILLDEDFEIGEDEGDSFGSETVRQALATEQACFIERQSCREARLQ
ncbi:hypothetical protein FMEXI_14392 [Fusarium mexicanum]|uniref:Uncharacterized protein n=1 Tax=Fusarium mexicanum TaxID=751941 RepID=A0A8H5I2U2_9HYPO|nr:hypothetical protein FMEXI_14392 [Fusarium mexicanum]